MNPPVKPQKNLSDPFYRWSISVVIILLLIIIGQYSFFRIDLTTEKRYTLSPVTKETLKQLNDMMFLKVYLDGDLPVEFRKFSRSVAELLDEFRIYGGENIQYQFINPSESPDIKIRNQLYQELLDKGLKVTNIQDRDEEGSLHEKIIFPGILIVHGDAEVPVNLLENNPGLSAEENLNISRQLLEYKLISTIRILATDTVKRVAFIEGHGEFDAFQTTDITRELANFFQVDRGEINGTAGILDPYEAVIIAGPTLPFSEADKFVLDQYLMKGGKILWFIDPVKASLDTLIEGLTVASIRDVNLNDMLFRYGVRLNPNLVEDVQCALIPVNTAPEGQTARFSPAPWMYYPLLNPVQHHPATRNIHMVRSEFASSIDTLRTDNPVKKIPLLVSSQYTRLVNAPVMVSLDQIRNTPPRQEFTKSFEPVAVLLEGKFSSCFRNRMLESLQIKGDYTFQESGTNTSMLVVADADIIRNDVRQSARGPLISPVGYDRYSRQIFGNRDFIVNTLNYMTDEKGIITLRNKEFRLRVLNREKIRTEKMKWQLMNTAVPVLLVSIAGGFVYLLRKRKYTRA